MYRYVLYGFMRSEMAQRFSIDFLKDVLFVVRIT